MKANKTDVPPTGFSVPSEEMKEGRLRIGFFLRKIYQKNQKIWQAMCPDKLLTPVQAGALGVLFDKGPCSLTELGDAAAIDPSTMRGVAERLRKRKLVSLRADKADRRKAIITLEESGKRLIMSMFPIMRQIADATLDPLNPAEKIALEYLINKLTVAEPMDR